MLIPSTLTTWEQKMIDDTSFETHRQQETKDFILQLRHLITEKDAEIKRLKTVLKNAVEIFEIEVPQGNPTIEEMRKAVE